MPNDTEIQQLIIYVGTQEKVNQARQQGTITENDFVVVTDAPEFALQSSVQAIQLLIPNGASFSNPLTTESFVNSSINNMAAFYDTADAQGNPFATKAALLAGPWYNKGELRTPTTNDYALVTADETHDDATSRFMYDGTQWVWQYTLNNTTFTQAQLDAINSTATLSKINQIATNTNAIGDLTTLQTSAKTSTVAAINELQTGKQATINDLSDIRNNASAGKTASDTIANYGNIVTHSVNEFVDVANAQDVNGQKTFKSQQKLQYGGGDSCLIIGADVTSNTVTANTRKLGRMAFHTNESTTLNCAFVSTDTQSATSASVIMNCVEFGGRPADTASTSPDVLNFTVAKVHNTTTVAEKQLALSITKDEAGFAVRPKYNGNDLVDTGTAQDITAPKAFKNGGNSFSGSVWNDVLSVIRDSAIGSYIAFKNTVNSSTALLGAIGVHQNEIPLFIDKNNTDPRAIVRAGTYLSATGNNASIGDISKPVYINNTGIATACTGVQEKSTIQALAATASITLADNYIYQGGTQTSLTITLPSTTNSAFLSEVYFTSGSTATTLSYSLSDINWRGDDLEYNITAQKKIFVPLTNKRYTIIFDFDGVKWNAVTRGV